MSAFTILIPVPMKGTMQHILGDFLPADALIPAPVKGTIFSLFFSLGFNPRAHEGYDVPLLVESNPGQDFNPRTRERYDIVYNERNYK